MCTNLTPCPIEHSQSSNPHLGQLLQSLHADRTAALEGKQLGRLDEVLDLSPVQPLVRQPLDVGIGQVELVAAKVVDEVEPDLLP